MGARWVLVAGVAAGGVVGCGPKQTVHVVRPGETLSEIGAAYGIDYRAIARANGITDPDWVTTGRRVLIPDQAGEALRRRPARGATGARRAGVRPLHASGPFRWPVERGRLTSRFGPRGRSHHDGVDIAAPRGLAIVAAAAGEVIYAGRLRGYGNVIIVDHGGGYASVYAHNDRNLVQRGAAVSPGEKIATVGRTGRTSGPHLHFEIRKNNVARDPMRYLPSQPVRAARLAR